MIQWAFLALKLFRIIRRRQNFDSQSAFTLDVLFCSNVSTPKPKWASFVYCAPARVTRQNKLFWKVKINRDIKQQFFFLFFVRGNRYVLIPLQSPGSKRWCILRCQARGNEYLMFRCNTWEDFACSRFTAKFHIVYATQKGDFFSPTCATSVKEHENRVCKVDPFFSRRLIDVTLPCREHSGTSFSVSKFSFNVSMVKKKVPLISIF